MPATKSIFMLAGEPSGDKIGAALMAGLAERAPGLRFSGVGGDEMASNGLQSLFPMHDLSVMGFNDVIRRLPLLLWRIRQAARFIVRTAPDCVVLIDSQVFSQLLAGQLRKRGYRGRIILYVAPSVWAWKPERAAQLKPLFDEVLAVLPFEPRVMAELGGPPTSYVGHPALARTPAPIRKAGMEKGWLTLLPGSRAGEIRRHMPLMLDMAAHFAGHAQVTGIALITLPRLMPEITVQTRNWPAPVHVVSAAADRDAVLARTRAALVTAGTATLELALAGVPMVGTYVPDKRLMQHYEKAGRPMIALPNIIMGERIVPEIPPEGDMRTAIEKSLDTILAGGEAEKAQRRAFAKMRRLMLTGEKDQRVQDAADRILAHLG